MRKNIIMPRRKEFKGIAGGLINSFLSRNNDIDGYWALGLFYQCAAVREDFRFELDLLSGKSWPYFEYSERSSKPYRDFLFAQLEKKGFEEVQAKKAIVLINFKTSPTKWHVEHIYTWGEPFVCRVSITDDLDREWFSEIKGWCGQHNLDREIRSTRRYAP